MAELPVPRISEPREAGDLVGELLDDRFEILERIDEGGMAYVYLGWDLQSGDEVAVKVLREGVASEEVRRRFFREAQSTMAMTSRHIVELHALGPADAEHAFFAMELLEGLRLDELCGEPLPFDVIYDYGRQIVAGLQVAHAKGIIHRDLKPENIFVVQEDGNDVLKLFDFGIAKHETASALTVPGAVFGTPHYMAPEQAAGRGDIGPQTDVYAVGVILYELVTGELPFDGFDAMQIMLAQIGLPPAPIRDRRPDCPAELEAIILRCLAKRPSDRYRSAAALREALDRAAGDAFTAAQLPALGEDVSGLRLRPRPSSSDDDDTPEIEAAPLGEDLPTDRTVIYDHAAAPIDIADLVGDRQAPASRPTPTEPTPWVAPSTSEATARRTLHLLLTLAVLAAVAMTLLAAHFG